MAPRAKPPELTSQIKLSSELFFAFPISTIKPYLLLQEEDVSTEPRSYFINCSMKKSQLMKYKNSSKQGSSVELTNKMQGQRREPGAMALGQFSASPTRYTVHQGMIYKKSMENSRNWDRQTLVRQGNTRER